MAKKTLTLKICAKIETDESDVLTLVNIINIKTFLKQFKGVEVDNIEVDIDNVKGSFNWDAETVIAEKEEDLTPYYKIADELYTKLLGDNRSFSDWEYKFISSNYEVAEAKGYYTPKQKEWLKKLEEKYL